MAAAEILATGSGAANSTDVTVTTTNVTVGLKGFGADAIVHILLKDDAGAYNRWGQISSADPRVVLTSPGLYRFSRPAGSGACGVFTG